MAENDKQRAERLTNMMVGRIAEFTNEEMVWIEEITKKVTAEIEGQNWTGDPLTDQEENVIAMAVSATFYEVVVAIRKEQNG